MAKNHTNAAVTLAIAAAAGGMLLLAGSARRRNRGFDFAGKVVLIAGSSRGLGLVLARQLAAEGARLVLCARDAEELEAARNELQSRGADVLAIPCDLTNRDAANALVNHAISHFGHIDVLINNAGTIAVGPIEHVTMDAYHEAMNVNFWAAVHVAYHVVPHMQERRSGRVVNIGSIGGKIGVPHLIPYSASKFALTGWSRGLRAELAKDGVVVTTVSPGLMRTGSPRNATFKGQNEKEYAWFKAGDSLPLLSVSAESAARDILHATREGRAELIVGALAKAGVLFDQLAPEWSSDLAAFAGRMLPAPGGVGERSMRGAESESKLTQTPLTALTDRAARENNELVR